ALLQRHDIDQAPLRTFSGYTASYQQKFNQLVESQQRLGLDAQPGLIGDLRQTAQQLEELLDQLGQDNLTILVLQLRRAEKDFLLRKDMAYAERFNTLFPQLLLQTSADSTSRALAEQYNQSFAALFTARKPA